MEDKKPWEMIGQTFIEQFYAAFDIKAKRHEVGIFYHPTGSLLTFEGAQHVGREEIVKKFTTIPLDDIMRLGTTADYQPTSEGGVLIHILGQLRNSAENDKVMSFSQTFLLKPLEGSYFIFNEIFRLVLHNISA